jgi:hypothetical protein
VHEAARRGAGAARRGVIAANGVTDTILRLVREELYAEWFLGEIRRRPTFPEPLLPLLVFVIA